MLKFLQNHYRDRPSTARGKNQAPIRSPRNNGHIVTSQETNFPERNSHELSQAHLDYHQGARKSGSSDVRASGFSETKSFSNVNGSLHLSERVVEFGSIGHLPLGGPSVESGGLLNPGSALAQNSDGSLLTPEMQRPKTALGVDQDRYDNFNKL